MSFAMTSIFGGFDGMSPFIPSLLGGTGVDDAEDMILRGSDANCLGVFAGTCAVVNQGDGWKLGFQGERELNIPGDASPPTGTRESNLPILPRDQFLPLGSFFEHYTEFIKRDFQLCCLNLNSPEIESNVFYSSKLIVKKHIPSELKESFTR